MPDEYAWINENFPYEAKSLRGLGLRDAKDIDIFQQAKEQNAVLISKDSDFLDLIALHGSPPQLILLKSGNTSNQQLREIFSVHLSTAIDQLRECDSVVEIE